MKTLPIIRCRSCHRLLEIEAKDVSLSEMHVGKVVCHVCKCWNNVRMELFRELFPEEEARRAAEGRPKQEGDQQQHPGASALGTPAEAGGGDRDEEGGEGEKKGIEALEAYLHEGSYDKAAKRLGVSGPTVKNRIDRLSEETKKQVLAGMVPAGSQ